MCVSGCETPCRQARKEARVRLKGKAILDGNRFPRHLWAYLVSGRGYSARMWEDTGLGEFELAHVFAHKEDEAKLERQFFDKFDACVRPYGNFTCAANVVLLPKGTVRPTDNSTRIKGIFFKRYIDLYGDSSAQWTQWISSLRGP